MNTAKQEQVLVSQRIHRAVFVLPLVAVVIIAIATLLPLLFVVSLFQPLFRMTGAAGPPWILLCFPLLFLALPELALLWLAWDAAANTEYVLTNRRLRFRSGLLCRRAGEVPLERIEAVFIREGLLGRMLGYGTIGVTGIGGTVFPLHFVPQAPWFHRQLQEAVEAVRTGRSSRRGSSVREPRQAPAMPPAYDEEDDSRYRPKRRWRD